MKNSVIYLILCLLLCVVSCKEKSKQQQPVTREEMKKSMETANRYLLNEEEEEIDRYMRRHGLEMIKTGTGLRYQILKQGSDIQIEKGQAVTLEYELHSIKGDLIYSSEKEGYKKFVIGDGSVESGLDEAVTYLHNGDVAKVIIPFHLAYGLHGDDRDIPEYATLVYTIKIVDIQ